jgi:hypothetical protein
MKSNFHSGRVFTREKPVKIQKRKRAGAEKSILLFRDTPTTPPVVSVRLTRAAL